MLGYIVASVFMNAAEESVICATIYCWRWPFLIEIFLLAPLYAGLYFVPDSHMDLAHRNTVAVTAAEYLSVTQQTTQQPSSHTTEGLESGKASLSIQTAEEVDVEGEGGPLISPMHSEMGTVTPIKTVAFDQDPEILDNSTPNNSNNNNNNHRDRKSVV